MSYHCGSIVQLSYYCQSSPHHRLTAAGLHTGIVDVIPTKFNVGGLKRPYRCLYLSIKLAVLLPHQSFFITTSPRSAATVAPAACWPADKIYQISSLVSMTLAATDRRHSDSINAITSILLSTIRQVRSRYQLSRNTPRCIATRYVGL